MRNLPNIIIFEKIFEKLHNLLVRILIVSKSELLHRDKTYFFCYFLILIVVLNIFI